MNYATDYIATMLRNAREAKGLSQRALAKLAGMPQGHISKIENGAVDLRVSSLVELARVLGLELAFVPRKNIAAVNAIVRSTSGAPRRPGSARRKAWRDAQAKLDELLHAYPASTELAQLQRLMRDLQRLGVVDRETLRDVHKRLGAVLETRDLEGVHRLLAEFTSVRNAAAQAAGSTAMTAKVRPAYSLEEDDGGE